MPCLYLVLAEEEGQQHQHASVVDDPPHVNVALGEALSVGREGGDVLGDEQGQVSRGSFPDQLCGTPPPGCQSSRSNNGPGKAQSLVTTAVETGDICRVMEPSFVYKVQINQ